MTQLTNSDVVNAHELEKSNTWIITIYNRWLIPTDCIDKQSSPVSALHIIKPLFYS